MVKTYKREVAILIVFFLFYLCIFGNPVVVEMVVWPFMLFVGAAFGMDWARSQLNEVNKSGISFSSTRRVQSSGPPEERTNA